MPSDVVCCVVCRAQHNTTQHDDADGAAVNDIDDSGEFENPVADESRRGSKQLAFKDLVKNPAADESQESHSPSPSFCLCNTMALCSWLATGSRRFNDMLELLRLREAFQQ